MNPAAQVALVDRYQQAGHALCGHIEGADRLARRFGTAYLDDCFAEDLLAELRLRDAYDACLAELLAELGREDVLFYRHGYYKVGALGLPVFRPGAPVEVDR